jgi:hypothetical protein
MEMNFDNIFNLQKYDDASQSHDLPDCKSFQSIVYKN